MLTEVVVQAAGAGANPARAHALNDHLLNDLGLQRGAIDVLFR